MSGGAYPQLLAWFSAHGFPEWFSAAFWMVLMAIAVIAFMMITVLILVWLERKVSADLQNRVGPNRVGGRFGLMQTMADALKLLLKEDIIPSCADRPVFILAPFLVFVPTFLVFLVLPFSDTWVVKDLNLGVLFVIAVSALPVIGLVMAGWGSNNKYAVLGAMRAVAQGLSYEIPLVLAMVCVVVAAGSMRVGDIVSAQLGGHWFIFRFPLQLAFVIYLIAAMAEVNRVPFDLPEAESELVAGYFTEYSGMRFALFFLAEFAHLFFVSAFAATLFFGAWDGPILPPAIWFLIKSYAFVIIIMWIRWTVPRLRIDQIMSFAWKLLVPASLLAVALTGIAAVYGKL
jgi:NADH-quinone oxidoreductase subunit H